MKKLFLDAFVIAALSLSGAGWVQAEESASGGAGGGGDKQEAHQACRAEAEKLCPGLKPGEGLGKCVDEHASELSAACQEHHKQMKARHSEKKEQRQEARAEVKEACATDQEKLCKGLEPGKGLFKCMKEHESELSEGCKAAIGEFKEHKPKHGKRGHKGKKGAAAAAAPAGE